MTTGEEIIINNDKQMKRILSLSYEEMCYTSLVTVYNSHVEQECQEDYVKVCLV